MKQIAFATELFSSAGGNDQCKNWGHTIKPGNLYLSRVKWKWSTRRLFLCQSSSDTMPLGRYLDQNSNKCVNCMNCTPSVSYVSLHSISITMLMRLNKTEEFIINVLNDGVEKYFREVKSTEAQFKTLSHMCQTHGPRATSGPPCNHIRPARSFYIIVINGPSIWSADNTELQIP